jgi:DNA-binding MarR family transcriptional regulator
MDAASLNFIGRKLLLLSERAMAAPEGMNPLPVAEMLVLRAVVVEPGLTVTDLAAQLGIAQSRISQVVTTLEQGGMLRRYPDANDRRRQRIEPSAQMTAEVERRKGREVGDVLDPLFVGVSAREKERLLAALARLHDLIRHAEEREARGP